MISSDYSNLMIVIILPGFKYDYSNNFQTRSIWSIEGILTSTTTQGQSGPGSNNSKNMNLHSPELQNKNLTNGDGGLIPLQGIQSPYSRPDQHGQGKESYPNFHIWYCNKRNDRKFILSKLLATSLSDFSLFTFT